MRMITIGIAALSLLTQRDCSANRPGTSDQPPTTQEARVLGIIDNAGDRTSGVLTAPVAVRAGEDFQVTITTFGGGCDRGGDTGVILTENEATVIVYDFTSATRPGVACAMILNRMPHPVTLRFTRPGEAVIRVWGRRVGSDAPPVGVPAVLEHRLMVGIGNVGQVPDQASPAAPWVVTEKGIGPVRVGMTIAEASQALGGDNLIVLSQAASCYYVKPARSLSGIAFMVVNGRIARVDVDSQTVTTESGARVGDSEERIKMLYSQVEVSPHKYTKGRYLTVMSGGEYQIIFETDGAKVIRYRAGRVPEVRWVEGCSLL